MQPWIRRGGVDGSTTRMTDLATVAGLLPAPPWQLGVVVLLLSPNIASLLTHGTTDLLAACVCPLARAHTSARAATPLDPCLFPTPSRCCQNRAKSRCTPVHRHGYTMDEWAAERRAS